MNEKTIIPAPTSSSRFEYADAYRIPSDPYALAVLEMSRALALATIGGRDVKPAKPSTLPASA